MTRFLEFDDNGELIRLIRCPTCSEIVARVYGDVEVRYRLVARTERDGNKAVLNGVFKLDNFTEAQAVAYGAEFDGARCSRCKIGYDFRDVRLAARSVVSSGRRSIKVQPRQGTL